MSTCLLGCAPTPAGLEGHVTIDGKPISEAAIMFVPLDKGNGKTGALLVDGHYTLPAQDGLLPGKYRVEIVDNPPLHAPASKTKRRVLPPEFSHASKLRFVMPPTDSKGPPYEANFDVKSGSPARAP